jgi:hypothetical protein
MLNRQTESYQAFRSFIAATGDTYVFNDETSVNGVGILLGLFGDMGLDPMKTADLRQGMQELFRIELLNMPDLEHNRFILAPNHVSDFDALVLGLLHPSIKIVSKNGWFDNERLRRFLDLHYHLSGLDRTSLQSLRAVIADAVDYFREGGEAKHYLVFSQGTISDFNRNSPERVSTIAQKISKRADVPILPLFVEQVSLEHPTRIVFGQPMRLSPGDDFRELWLRQEAAMQNALTPAARMPKLTEKHANNNKPGDLYF